MRFKAAFLFAAGSICLLALSISAFGHPPTRDGEARHDTRTAQTTAQRATPALRQPPASYFQRVLAVSKSMVGGSALVAEARKYLGTNPTDRKTLWCATFMNFVLAKLGYAGTNSDAARSFAYYGRRISEPRVGAIAVLSRGRNGGHVGVVTGFDARGNPIIISGNHNQRVGIGIYPRSRVIAYVMPTRRDAVPTRFAKRGRPAPGIDSPITELLAAINAEPDRSPAHTARPEAVRAPAQLARSDAVRAPVRVARPEAVRPPPRVAQPEIARQPERPVQTYRVVQQMPDQLPIDPGLAELLGIKVSAATQARFESQH